MPDHSMVQMHLQSTYRADTGDSLSTTCPGTPPATTFPNAELPLKNVLHGLPSPIGFWNGKGKRDNRQKPRIFCPRSCG